MFGFTRLYTNVKEGEEEEVMVNLQHVVMAEETGNYAWPHEPPQEGDAATAVELRVTLVTGEKVILWTGPGGMDAVEEDGESVLHIHAYTAEVARRDAGEGLSLTESLLQRRRR